MTKRQTDRETDRETEKQTEKQTERQKNRHKNREIERTKPGHLKIYTNTERSKILTFQKHNHWQHAPFHHILYIQSGL